ncbi:MAG: hypothetical protein R3C10_14450 [Pirellulales bacterium]
MRLLAEFTLQVTETGWAHVPLGLAGAVLDGETHFHEVDMPHYLAADSVPAGNVAAGTKGTGNTVTDDRPGYVLWMQADKPGEYRLTVPLLLPTEPSGTGGHCSLALPLVAQSKLTLAVPDDELEVSVSARRWSPRTTMRLVLPAPTRPQRRHRRPMVGTALGRRWCIAVWVVRWRCVGGGVRRRTSPPAVLEALDGNMLVSIDGQTITSEALLKVRSLGGPLERFYVRLPEAAELIPREPTGYRTTVLTDAAALPPPLRVGLRSAVGGASSFVEITLDKPTTETAEVRLLTQRRHRVEQVNEVSTDRAALPGPAAAQGPPVDLGGFEVLGAMRQSGYVGVGVVGDWQINWSPPRGVRQVAALPDLQQRGELAAGFEYVSQPFSLPLQVAARSSRIGVEPTYVVRVEPDGLYLEAQLDFAIRSAHAFGVSVDMSGWTVDEIGPANVVDLDGVDTEANAPLFIPFLQSMIGEAKVFVRARRELDDTLSFDLPLPVANARGPAELVILPADNVVVSPRTTEMQGLRLETAPPSVSLPPRRQEPLVYRAGRDRSRFVATAEVMSGTLSAQVESTLIVSGDDVTIEQVLAFDAAYEAVADVGLMVPVADAPLEVRAGQSVLDLQAAPNQSTSGPDAAPPGYARVVAVLPTPKIGKFELTVRQRRPLDDLEHVDAAHFGESQRRGWRPSRRLVRSHRQVGGRSGTAGRQSSRRWRVCRRAAGDARRGGRARSSTGGDRRSGAAVRDSRARRLDHWCHRRGARRGCPGAKHLGCGSRSRRRIAGAGGHAPPGPRRRGACRWAAD